MSSYKNNNASLRPPKMKHIRHIKGEFFDHEDVNALSLEAALGWIGIWTCSDKHGRFEWKPKTLKHHIFPYRDVDFDKVLNELLNADFIEKYEVSGQEYGRTPSWEKHQGINTSEYNSKFEYPAPPSLTAVTSESQTNDSRARVRL
jgi:hypothetical protein